MPQPESLFSLGLAVWRLNCAPVLPTWRASCKARLGPFGLPRPQLRRRNRASSKARVKSLRYRLFAWRNNGSLAQEWNVGRSCDAGTTVLRRVRNIVQDVRIPGRMRDASGHADTDGQLQFPSDLNGTGGFRSLCSRSCGPATNGVPLEPPVVSAGIVWLRSTSR